MAYEITISKNGAYIIGKIIGSIDLNLAEELAFKYVKLIKSSGIKRILNDLREATNEMFSGQEYSFANSIVKQIGLPRGIRAAILTNEGDLSHSFHETAARNAGYDIRVFFSYEKAVVWLMASDSNNN